MENDLRTDKKECPKCESENVQYVGTSGGTRVIKEGESALTDLYQSSTCRII